MRKDLEERVLEVIDSGNFDEIKKWPLSERARLLNPKVFVNKLLSQRLDKNFVLISEEESLEIYNKQDIDFLFDFDIMEQSDNPFIKYHLSLQRLFIEKYKEDKSEENLKPIRNSKLQWELVQQLKKDDVIHFHLLNDDVLERMIVDRRWRNWAFSIIRCFSDDLYRIKFLPILSLDDKVDAISILESDALKEQYLLQIPVNKRGRIVSAFSSDETKKKYVNGLMDCKASVISSFESDEDKIAYLERFKLVLSQEDKGSIIAHFNDIENIKKYLGYINKESGLVSFFQNFVVTRDIELSRQLLSYIRNTENQSNLWGQIRGSSPDLDNTFINMVTSQKVLYKMVGGSNLEQKKAIVRKLDPIYVNKYIKERPEDSTIIFFAYCTDMKMAKELLQHADFNEPYNDEYRALVERVANYYKVNFEHLLELTKITNCHVLNFMENENIIKAINLNDEDFQKYLRIFDKKNHDINMSTISSVITSLGHKAFALEHPEEIEMFINTLHDVDDNRRDEAISKIRRVCSVVQLSKYNIDINTLINGVLAKDEKIIQIYNSISYEYLTNRRNEFLNATSPSMLDKCTEQGYEKNSMIKFCFKYLTEEEIKGNFYAYGLFLENMSDEVKRLYANRELINKLIHYKKDPSKFGPITDDIKFNLRPFGEMCAVIFSKYLSTSRKVSEITPERSIPPTEPSSFVSIMANIDTAKLKDTVLGDDALFEELLERLEKYDMIGWSDRFEEVGESTDIEINNGLVGAYISGYALIAKTRREKLEQNKRFTFMSELNLADCLDSDASIYSTLIGQEDYRLIRRNPSPNPSPTSKKSRISSAISYIKKMHERKYITVPPVDEIVSLKSGKKINIKVGNTNDMINLTYGERTGACMRIGGAGKTLFDFCLEDENGFHMSFNDPVTGELVSRVSCFRNGNTLFLNQLRYSLNKKYDNEDVIDACTILCQRIIEMTKNSKYPIENAIASDCYAFAGARTVNYNCSNIKKGLPHFYCDIAKAEAVVVATSKGGILSEIKTNPAAAERYPIGRGRIKQFDQEKAATVVQHIEALDMLYSGQKIDDITVEDKEVNIAYAGEDWYVALLENGEVISYIQTNSLNREAAEREVQQYMHLLESAKSYGGIGL